MSYCSILVSLLRICCIDDQNSFLLKANCAYRIFLVFYSYEITATREDPFFDVSQLWRMQRFIWINLSWCLFEIHRVTIREYLMGTSLRHYIVRCKYSVLDPSGALKLHEPINSHEWSRQNFSKQYQYNVKKTSDKNFKNIIWGVLVDPIQNSLN